METNFVQHSVNVAYDQAVATYGKKQVIGAFVYGSQNYGLADEKSDVDVKVLLLPSATDIYMNAKPVSKEGEFQLPTAGNAGEWRPVCPSDIACGSTYGKIVYRDIRLWQGEILKGNPNAFELLFAHSYRYNNLYERELIELFKNREKISKINPAETARICTSMAKNISTRLFKSEKCLDLKQFVNICRLAWFLRLYFLNDEDTTTEQAFTAAGTPKNVRLRRLTTVVEENDPDVLEAMRMISEMKECAESATDLRYSKQYEHLFTSQIWEMINKGYLMTIPVDFPAPEAANITTSKLTF